MAGTCSDCPFAAAAGGGLQCRIRPPVAQFIPGQVQGSIIAAAVFPPVKREDWCGAHPLRAASPAVPLAVADPPLLGGEGAASPLLVAG